MKLLNRIRKEHDNKKYWQAISRSVAPPSMEEYKDHIVIGDSIVKVLMVGLPFEKVAGWPAGLNPGFMDQLLDIGRTQHVTISITAAYIPIPPHTSVNMYEATALKLAGNKDVSKHSNNFQIVDQFLNVEANHLFEEANSIIEAKSKLFHTAFTVVIMAADDAKMRVAMSHIKSVLSANCVQNEPPEWCMLETLESSLLTSHTSEYSWVELLTDKAVSIAPLKNPNSRLDDGGLLFGEDTKTGKDVIINLDALPAQHMQILGPTGSGKTYTMLFLLMRTCSLLNRRIIYTTPKADATTNYKAVAESYGKNAAVLDLGPGGRNINPLQIMYDQDISRYTHEKAGRLYDDHKDLINAFFKVWLKKDFSPNMEALLDKTLNQVYKSKGIIRDDIRTWDGVEWPVMTDLISIWYQLVKDDKDKKGTAGALVDKTYKFNKEGSWNFINSPTDIDLTADFIIIDFSGIPYGLQDSMNMLVTGMLGMRFKIDTERGTIITVDEGRVYLKNPELGEFIIKIITQGRSYGVYLWLSILQISDLKDVSDEIKTNMFISLVLGGNVKQSSIKIIQDYFGLDDTACKDLINAGVGQGLLIKDDFATPITFKATDYEHSIIKGTAAKDDTAGKIEIDQPVAQLAADNQIYFDDWIHGDSVHILTNNGYKQISTQIVNGNGKVKTWIKQSLISNDMIGNQSIDHYASVCQLAGILVKGGFAVEINHYNDADIVARNNGVSYAFEYERSGSHNKTELIEKYDTHMNHYTDVFFICSGENHHIVKDAVGKNAIKRGTDVRKLINQLKGEVIN
ncbi:Type IV secretory pathway, VirB4 component [Candidatus Methanomarinus sp.]|nr:Type IV secretory pathway, VirB4 component [ANME-2 cluster archaeon]